MRACACGQRQHEPPLGSRSLRPVLVWLGIHVASGQVESPGLAAAPREFLPRRRCSAARAPMAIAPHVMRRPQPARWPHAAASPHRPGSRGLTGVDSRLARAGDAGAGGRAGAASPAAAASDAVRVVATAGSAPRRRDRRARRPRRAGRGRRAHVDPAALDDYHGASRFTTWASKFAVHEAGVKGRRSASQAIVVPEPGRGRVNARGDARRPGRTAQHDPRLSS